MTKSDKKCCKYSKIS